MTVSGAGRFTGDILERLDASEERVVFAHEMSHLVNRDIWPMLLLRVGSGASHGRSGAYSLR
jgi:Zn-dependent protease with chaperone function